jgi:glycosyltransferase involved in cell wall biosynthesis
MEKKYNWMINKKSTFYNGINLDVFKPVSVNNSNNAESINKFLVLGTVKSLKNVVELVKAVVYLKKYYNSDFVVRWAGRISDRPQKLFIVS